MSSRYSGSASVPAEAFRTAERILRPDADRIDTDAWQPLLYVFRDYFGTGPKLGRTRRR